MCRLYAMLTNDPTKVECSLLQTQKRLLQRPGEANGSAADCWGIVCYDEEDRWRCPTLVRHTAATLNPQLLDSVAEVYSQAVVAHVRAATVGAVSSLNTHPFTYDEWTFAHNGTIPCFAELCGTLEAEIPDRYLDCRLGDTDSELFFLWLLSRLEAVGLDSSNIPDRYDDTVEAICDAVCLIANRCHEAMPEASTQLNFVLTNGHLILGCCWNNPLYELVREGVYDCEVCGVPHIHHSPTGDHRAVVIASQPLTAEPWREIPNHSLIYVSPNLTCTIEPIPHDAAAEV